jgi:hypothetical protein
LFSRSTVTVTYLPNIDFNGIDRFTYKATNERGTSSNESKVLIKVQVMKANAGHDQIAARGALVTLDASKSEDVDGQIISYVCKQLKGQRVMIEDPTAAKINFHVAAVTEEDTTLTFQATVTDDIGHLRSDEAEVKIINTIKD